MQDNSVFEERLEEEILKLKKCQEEKQLKSCSLCEHYIGCETRRAYVQAVYDSMSKGETGGFEF
ncbi:MAG: hypothetical protein PF439_01190 [Helicobacteraceae bacterium]|jgi:hypothetical protein|nr:hypothetical protein [Helicobacteraceae bacterium]